MYLLLAEANFTVNAGWLVVGGFCAAFGAGIWKLLPKIIKWSLEDVIESSLTPEIQKINDRIDGHMDSEESSFNEIQQSVSHIKNEFSEMKNKLDQRTELFDNLKGTMDKTNEILDKHIDDDKIQFAAAQQALVDGQQDLINQLKRIQESTEVKKKKKS
jgi:hypothetical protein